MEFMKVLSCYVHFGKTPTYKTKFSIFRVYLNKGIEMVKLDLSSQDNAFIRGMNYLPKVKKFLGITWTFISREYFLNSEYAIFLCTFTSFF